MPKDLFSLYNLPPLQRALEGSEAFALLAKARILDYAKKMPVDFSAVIRPEFYLDELRGQIQAQTPLIQSDTHYLFNGKKASELNAFLQGLDYPAQVTLTSDTLQVDEPIHLKNNLSLLANQTNCLASEVGTLFLGKDVSNIVVSGFIIQQALANAVVLTQCTHVQLQHFKILNSQAGGIVLQQHCAYIHIENCQFIQLQQAAISLQAGTHHCHIQHCEITAVEHQTNSAAIMITALDSTAKYQPTASFASSYSFPNGLALSLPAVPHQNIVEHCHIHHNHSAGIAIVGGNANVFYNNAIEHNDKEGLYLAFFATANILLSNTLTANGLRNQPAGQALELECLKQFPQLSDDSSSLKLANICLDNSALNIIIKNNIANAAGDGIKMIRACLRNMLAFNSIIDNNQGANFLFCFSAIVIGLSGDDAESTTQTAQLDNLPCIENILLANMMFGQHTRAIIYETGSVYNDTIDNFVMKQRAEFFIEKSAPNNRVGNNFPA